MFLILRQEIYTKGIVFLIFCGDALEQVVDEGVHDAHGGDTGVGVHLLEDLVDVDGIRVLPFLVPHLLVSLGNSLGGFS